MLLSTPIGLGGLFSSLAAATFPSIFAVGAVCKTLALIHLNLAQAESPKWAETRESLLPYYLELFSLSFCRCF